MKLMLPIMAILFTACSNQKIKYPETVKDQTIDNYFGTMVADPYRWLEDDRSEQTGDWVNAQNEVTKKYLSGIPFREKIRERLTQLWNYSRMRNFQKKGLYYFYYFNSGLQNQDVIMYKKRLSDAGEVFLNPNLWSEDGTVALSEIYPSNDGKYVAYVKAVAGSDWNEFYIKEINGLKDLPDHLIWIKFSEIAWYRDGFFYSRFKEPEEGDALTGENMDSKVFYHQVGTAQSADVLIYEDRENPGRSFNPKVSEDERFLIISAIESTSGNAVYVKDLTKMNSEFVRIVENFKDAYAFIDNAGSKLYLHTNYMAPKYRLISVDMSNPNLSAWLDVIPENKDQVLETCSFSGNKIVAKYLKDARNLLSVFTREGKYLYDIELPGIGTVLDFNSSSKENEAFYQFTSFNYPASIFSYHSESGETELVFKPEVDFNPDEYITEQVFYNSKDGTRIPMFLVHKKDIRKNGKNPTLLYGYGGFNITMSPSFSVRNIIWLENGGIYALANIRGGGEYGEEWHQAGAVLNKQNVFDDFIAAAEYLAENKFTSSKRLTIFGGSNGGLLVGAVTNQRPELFAVSIPAVGVMDMLRYHKFTIGRYWASDYGTSDDSTQFEYILKYSPIHNIKKGTGYPAVFVTTADHDDRVVPAHSFKYIASLQEKYDGKNPALIRIETRAGHSAGKPMTKVIAEYTDMWSFAFYNMDFVPGY